MTGHDKRQEQPTPAGGELAELADQLRLCPAGEPGAASAVWHGRLAAAARCWRRLAVESGDAGCAERATGLQHLAAALAAGAVPDARLVARLLLLDERLAGLLAGFDAGADAAGLVAAESPDTAPDRRQAGAPATGTVALLVASPFLREMLAARLADAGRPAVALAEPRELAPLLASPRPPVLVLCDNEQPTNHLRRLRGLLAGYRGTPPALVLVASAGEAAPGRERRARAAGADATWPEPWHPERLPAGGVSAGNA